MKRKLICPFFYILIQSIKHRKREWARSLLWMGQAGGPYCVGWCPLPATLHLRLLLAVHGLVKDEASWKKVFENTFLIGGKKKKNMSSSAIEADTSDLVCQLDNVQGIVDALSTVRWKRHQVYHHISLSLLISFSYNSRVLSFNQNHTTFQSESLFFNLLYCYEISGRSCWIIGTRHRFDCWRNRLSSSQSLSSKRGDYF